ncbi:MAG: hypothetical protein A2092_11405 [Rhodobacteraceae bacterium GWE1_64_9]|nr:MAG: hypothetical protein A2092_11405 [Rhodobacteraceae bacterium GWE1_64_9]OHC49460.1 MAG: hypothetical protein A2X69_19915 [Rhodobacteraceae bacterium GWF1_65_7]
MPVEVLKSPASVSVIDGAAIKKTAPVSVAKLISDVPGLQVSGNGIDRIAIRGEGASRVAVLIDGQKLTDHTNYGQPLLIDPGSIDRIEVVRGSSSVISGSQAIGGVVNIITKKGAEKPFGLTTQAGYMSATDGYRLSATASGTVEAGAGALDYRLTAGSMSQGDRKSADGLVTPSDTSDNTVSAHLGYRTGQHYFGLKLLSYDLSANVFADNPDFIIQMPKRDMRRLGVFYEGENLTPWLRKLSFDAYRQTVDRSFRNDITMYPAGIMHLHVESTSEDAQLTYGANLRAEMQFSENSRTYAGIEFTDDSLTTDKYSRTTVRFRGAPFPISDVTTLRYDEATIRTTSVFAQHEISLNDALTATFGARWYHVEASHDVASTNGVARAPTGNRDDQGLVSAGLVWSPDESLVLRANISQGYIYPSLSQLFLNTTAGGTAIAGNPDLDPERATTFEIGARYDAGGALIDATLFHTRAKDYIASVQTDPVTRARQYMNLEEAKSWGLELHAEYALPDLGLTPYITATALRRKITYANGFSTRDSGMPDLSGRIGLRKSWSLGAAEGEFDFFLRAASGTVMRGADGLVAARDANASKINRSAGYGTLNLHTTAEFGNGTAMVLELNNLTDRSYESWDYVPGEERSVNIFLTKTF